MPIDLSLPDAELLALVEKRVRADPGFKPREEWIAEMAQRIAQATARRGRREAARV
jgi:2-hydroxy-3-keto-5-methylthiopentenyl-1-phosphate phosphatase